MSGRFDQPDSYSDWDEDPEGPQERDLIDEDEDQTPTVPCPSCREPIPDFADRCPYCGDWVVQSAGQPSHRRPWFIALAILVLLIVLAWSFW